MKKRLGRVTRRSFVALSSLVSALALDPFEAQAYTQLFPNTTFHINIDPVSLVSATSCSDLILCGFTTNITVSGGGGTITYPVSLNFYAVTKGEIQAKFFNESGVTVPAETSFSFVLTCAGL